MAAARSGSQAYDSKPTSLPNVFLPPSNHSTIPSLPSSKKKIHHDDVVRVAFPGVRRQELP